MRPEATGSRRKRPRRARGSRSVSPSRPSRSYFLVGIPALELDDELDRLRRAHRRDAEEMLDVDDADPAQLHVVADHLGGAARRARRSGTCGSRRRRRRRAGGRAGSGRARTRSCRCRSRRGAARPCRRRRRGRRGASSTGASSSSRTRVIDWMTTEVVRSETSSGTSALPALAGEVLGTALALRDHERRDRQRADRRDPLARGPRPASCRGS